MPVYMMNDLDKYSQASGLWIVPYSDWCLNCFSVTDILYSTISPPPHPLTIGFSPDRHQAIIWTPAGLLLMWPQGTYLSEIRIEIKHISSKKIRLKKKWSA